jgi:transposase InsO family protein
MSRIVCLHGVPKKIVSDRGTQFTSHFWQQLHEALGTHLNFSLAYHPQTESPEGRLSECAKSDGITSLRKKQPGSVKMI